MFPEYQLMDALVKAEAGPGLTLMKMPVPEPGLGEVRIRIRKIPITEQDSLYRARGILSADIAAIHTA